LDTIWLSISAGSGPEECAHAAALTVQAMQREINERSSKDIKMSVIESEDAREKGNIRSALISLEGESVQEFADSWTGAIQWIWQSTYRPHHKRKNWFIQVKQFAAKQFSNSVCAEPKIGDFFSVNDVRFETAKASGPGGQYVNKTETAVRAVHIPTGKSAVARDERSQLLNKRLALAKLARLFLNEQIEKENQSRSNLRHSHWELERGNPVRVYDGESMKLIRRKK